MFGKGDRTPEDDRRGWTLIGKGSVGRGTLTAKESMRVDGHFEGEIDVVGDVMVSEGGTLKAKIKAQNLLIAGKVEGEEVELKGKMEVVSTGRFIGNVQATVLIVEEGAVVKGKCEVKTASDRAEPDEERKDGSGKAESNDGEAPSRVEPIAADKVRTTT